MVRPATPEVFRELFALPVVVCCSDEFRRINYGLSYCGDCHPRKNLRFKHFDEHGHVGELDLMSKESSFVLREKPCIMTTGRVWSWL